MHLSRTALHQLAGLKSEISVLLSKWPENSAQKMQNYSHPFRQNRGGNLFAVLHDCKCLWEAQLAELSVLTQTWTSCVKTAARVHAAMGCCVTRRRKPHPGTKNPKRSRRVGVSLPSFTVNSVSFKQNVLVYGSVWRIMHTCKRQLMVVLIWKIRLQKV